VKYPTPAQVEQATHRELARWYRFLASPGSYTDSDIPAVEYTRILQREEAVLNKIILRFKELGGMTPELSKEIGW